jgi:signal transduction histidine kinase
LKKPGIHARIIFSAFFLIFAATLSLDLAAVHITRQFMNERFKDRIAFLARYLALNSEVGVLIGDRDGLKSLALNLLGEEDVARVIIMDNQNNQFVNLHRKVPGELISVEAPVTFKQTRNEGMVIFSNQITPLGKRPITGAEHIGTVKILYSTLGIQRLMNRITLQFFWISIGLAVMAFLMFFFLSRSITLEVGNLVSTAKQVARGDLTLRAAPGRLPETTQLSKAFNAMLDSLARSRKALQRVNQQMIQQKTLAEVGRFSLMVAHEVKNPIAIIKSSLDILKKELAVGADNLMVDYIEDEIRRLNLLIEDFLMFARPAKPKYQLTDVNSVLSSIVDRFKIQENKAPAVIEVDIPEEGSFASIDRDLITRSMSNIIRNACEAAGGEGWVGVSASGRDGKWIAEITDNGAGIDPAYREKIFEPFFTTRSKGTGLGLAFALHVIKAHGGTIKAENREEGGARFRVEIPLLKGKKP